MDRVRACTRQDKTYKTHLGQNRKDVTLWNTRTETRKQLKTLFKKEKETKHDGGIRKQFTVCLITQTNND